MINHADESLSLHDLLATLEGVVSEWFPVPLWVRCEILAAHPRAKGYWRLQVQDPERRQQAAAEVLVWRGQVPAVIQRFERMTGQPLQAGMQVLLQVKVQYSPQWGLTLTAQGIDPAFTLGLAQQEQIRIQQVLQAEGIWEAQHRLPAPQGFTRVLLLAPDGSAGLGDVARETDRLDRLGLCQFETHTAPFEGPQAIPRLTAWFEQWSSTVAAPYDAILMVRGGGGTAGIQTLNHEALVRAVCRCPIPVLVGIGHERDRTLLDDVAFASFGTPSKTIAHVTQTIVEQAREAAGQWQWLEQTVQRRLEQLDSDLKRQHEMGQHLAQRMTQDASRQVDALMDTLVRDSERLAQQAEQTLEHRHQEIRSGSLRLLENAARQTQSWMEETLGLGPQATLARGYVWVSTAEGRPVTRHDVAQHESTLTLHFHDGDVIAQPTGPSDGRP